MLFRSRFRTWAQTRPGDFAACALTELGYIRVLNAVYGVTVTTAKQQLRSLKSSPSVIFWREAESPVDVLPTWVTKHNQTSDGYLCALAKRHGAKLATFDTGIKDPAAFLIP